MCYIINKIIAANFVILNLFSKVEDNAQQISGRHPWQNIYITVIVFIALKRLRGTVETFTKSLELVYIKLIH